MKIPSISTYSLKLLSGLGNNENSLTAMVIKDWIGDGATVYTYKKEGGKDDAKEKAIEEFGTGAVWLFGIPTLKKIIEKTAYPFFKLDPKFTPEILEDKQRLANIKSVLKDNTQDAYKKQEELFETLDDKNPVLKKFTNAQMYKGMGIAKFAVATAISAFALIKIIKYKQKTTSERIKKDFEKNNSKPQSKVMDSVKENKLYDSFTGQKHNSSPSFTGFLSSAINNPIQNTKILDAVIATTRLKEGRKGERKEIAFKEACQIFFIYMLAEPIQKFFEKIGGKIKRPIELDPKVLFSKNLKEEIENSKDAISELQNSKDVIKSLNKLDLKGSLIKLLDKNDAISTIKKDGEIKAIDFTKKISDDKIKKTLENLNEIKDKTGNIKSIRAFKVFALIANILIGAAAMGILQPKLNILIRKALNNGDKTNPAIACEEANMRQKVEAHQG